MDALDLAEGIANLENRLASAKSELSSVETTIIITGPHLDPSPLQFLCAKRRTLYRHVMTLENAVTALEAVQALPEVPQA